MYVGPHIKYRLFLSSFIETCIFSAHFRRKLKYQITYKSTHRESSCSMLTDGRTDETVDRHDEGNSQFSRF